MTSLFVTGFDGYLGSNVTRALITRKVEVHVLARDQASAARAVASGLEPHITSLEDAARLTEIAASMDGIAHLAASDNPAFLPVNETATMAMLKGLAPGAPFVMQGGSMVFGDTGVAGVTGLPAFAPPPPLAARAAFEQRVLAAAETGVRPHVTYGSFVFGGRGAMLPNAFLAAARRERFSAYVGDGTAVWSAVHVEDWAELIARVLLDGKTTGGQIVFAAAQEIVLRDAAAAVGAAFSPPLDVRSVGIEEAIRLFGFFGPGLGVSQRFDRSLARNLYGWSPPPRDLGEELRRLAESTG